MDSTSSSSSTYQLVITTLIVILNLFILESLLSIDNAAVLAVMVNHLPYKQSKLALRYGMIGAFVARGLCLFIAHYIMGMWYLATIGGMYLLYLTYKYFFKDNSEDESKTLSTGFWKTVILVELADLTFSVDNIFAAVALSPTYWVVLVGVCMGIVAMRFVSGYFLKLLKKYPSLERSAFIVIGLLGLKLVITSISKPLGWSTINNIAEHHSTDLIFSGCMMLIFFIPLIKRNEELTLN